MEPANTLDALMLKAIIKESVREVMREKWFKFFEMLIPYVDDVVVCQDSFEGLVRIILDFGELFYPSFQNWQTSRTSRHRSNL